MIPAKQEVIHNQNCIPCHVDFMLYIGFKLTKPPSTCICFLILATGNLINGYRQKLNSIKPAKNIPTSVDWFKDLRILILPPFPSAPTAIKSPVFVLKPCLTSLFGPRLHHLPKYLFDPSGPSNPPEKHMFPKVLKKLERKIKLKC